MPDFGIKISKAGKDVGTASVQDMILHSEANSLKIVSQGSAVISVGAAPTEASTTVAHNLGFTPFYLTYFELTSGASIGKTFFQNSSDVYNANDFIFGTANVDGTNIYLKILNNGTHGAFTGTAHYILFGNKSF